MVEWKKFGEVCKVHTGSQLNRADMHNNGLFPVVNGGKEYSGYTNTNNEKANTITISQGGESAGYVNWIDVDFWAGAHCYVIEKSDYFNERFLYHALKNIERDLQSSKQGAGIPGLNRATLYKHLLPTPSLQEQERIVGILDTFTTAIDNLKKQIEERRKQYEFYRDQLLDLEGKEGVVMKTLKELCNIITKQTGFDYSSKIKPGLLVSKTNDSIPFLQTKNFSGLQFDYNTDYYVPSYIVEQFPKIVLDKECLLLSIVGASIGNVGLFPGIINCFLGGAICVLKFKENINIHYVYEVMSSWYGQKQIRSKIKGAGQDTITVEDIRNFVIPYPSKIKQNYIVNILGCFESIINNLEAQLEQRQKQYEYYRNKLLTFE